MTEFRADLHCHTTCSDGSCSPEEVVNLAVSVGLRGLSITDHDCIDAYETTLPIAQDLGIAMISGVEFSCSLNHVSVHILGYAFSLSSELIKNFCLRHQERREKRNLAILHLLARHGMPISEEEMRYSALDTASPGSIGRPHIAIAMMKKGYVGSVQEAFTKYLREGMPCYAAGDVFTVQETIDLIHQANGLAVLAHPHLIENRGLLKSLLKMNFDGLEGYYAKIPATDEKEWIDIAQKKGWLITGGSDFHGAIKPKIPLGCSWVNEETFHKLQTHFMHN